ncbi:hypothetical protein P3T27_006555 [Kitasatospora sp. MAA19]|uniref:hypothetical protein n=1 Tax=Kitasatospora sp. MAA19 TaxID=3035090 RepID=UPI002475CD83|nr:hypothetical protein [Kitasatospora sp. MAA19]MDH6709806.1 hypothetical protein [Kitasatospora sp. MAA19]
MVDVQVSQMAASVGAATGLVAMGVGSVTDQAGEAISGSALLLVSAMVICVQVILRALRDTATERAALAEERDLAIAAQAVVASERERMRADLARGRKAAQDMLDRERRALFQALEEERFSIQRRAIAVALKMESSGMLDEPPVLHAGTVVRLPVRQPMDDAALAASDD